MKACTYCGQENGDDARQCRECGQSEFRDLSGVEPSAEVSSRIGSGEGCQITPAEVGGPAPFFQARFAVMAVSLIGVCYFLFACLNVWLAKVLAQRAALLGSYPRQRLEWERNATTLHWGVFFNLIIAGACLISREALKSHSRTALGTVVLCITTAFCITARTSIIWIIKGEAHYTWIEPIFIWPVMLYALVYAIRQIRRPR
jgi:hypothetical protein